MNQTIPVARGCPRCGGWFTRRALHAEEPRYDAYHCVPCGEDIRLIDGVPVSLSRPPDVTVTRDLARHNHAAAVNATTARKRLEAGT